MPRILTMDQLVNYFEENNLLSFSAKEAGEPIVVRMPAHFELQESDDFTLFATIRAWHIGKNANGCNATEKASKKAMKNLAYKPVLANFTDVNGEWDFTSHDVDVDQDGNVVYVERQIGCFTADAPYIQHDDEYDKDFIYARVAIPREYTEAANIIERKQGTKVSVEMAVNEMGYSTTDKTLNLNDFEIVGVTCLGTDPETGNEVQEGMKGSRIEFEDVPEPIMFTKSEIRKLKKLLQSYNLKEGGNPEMTKFEELLQMYNKTAEEIDFEYEDMTDEELEAKFAEVFGEQNEATPSEEGESEQQPEESEPADDNAAEFEQNEAEENEQAETATITEFSVKFGDITRNFSLTLHDKLNALYELINTTYAEDGDWYSVDANEEKKVVYFYGFAHSYRQAYTVRKGEFSLVGDRAEIHPVYITDEEEQQIQEKLNLFEENANALEESHALVAKYESEPEKMQILNSDDYKQIAESEEFVMLKNSENHFDLSVDEVRAKADALLLNFAKTGVIEPKTESQVMMFGAPENRTTQRGRYGGIFRKK